MLAPSTDYSISSPSLVGAVYSPAVYGGAGVCLRAVVMATSVLLFVEPCSAATSPPRPLPFTAVSQRHLLRLKLSALFMEFHPQWISLKLHNLSANTPRGQLKELLLCGKTSCFTSVGIASTLRNTNRLTVRCLHPFIDQSPRLR